MLRRFPFFFILNIYSILHNNYYKKRSITPFLVALLCYNEYKVIDNHMRIT
jgi:hypothetical protein